MDEAESTALTAYLTERPQQVSSIVADVELHRVVARHPGAAQLRDRTERLLAALRLLAVDERVVLGARGLAPPELRALDAIHLATALSLGDDLAAVVTYDARLQSAAAAAGTQVDAPA